ncbi:MAG: sterol desaturase, partial [Dolichospermum sp.]
MILAQSLTIDSVLVNNCIQFTTWGFSSLLLAEIVRDAYHALCHQVTWLAKWHNKHHA